MSQTPTFSSPQVFPSTSSNEAQLEQYTLGGIAVNVKLLLKLVHDHNGGIPKDNDERRSQRVAGMLSIIDDLQSRIAQIQSRGRGKAELRRCQTELRPQYPQSPRDKKGSELVPQDKESLARQLKASLAAKKSLEILCSSLGKEKEIMASELLRKVQEHAEMEEHINDLKAQNEMLMEKVHVCAAEHRDKSVAGEMQGNVALQERNKALSEQLLKTLDGYRSLKRRLKSAQEENIEFQQTIEEIAMEIQHGVVRIRRLQERIASRSDGVEDIREEISAVEQKLLSLYKKVIKQRQKKTESD